MADWTDQVAIVTGGSRGIGRAIARALAARGAAICINYASRTAEAEPAATEIAAAGRRVIAIQADVADADAVARMVVRTEAELGPVSILVNNAGISSPATLESYTLQGWIKCASTRAPSATAPTRSRRGRLRRQVRSA